MEKFHYIIIVQSLPNTNYNRALALLLSSPSLERWTNSHGTRMDSDVSEKKLSMAVFARCSPLDLRKPAV